MGLASGRCDKVLLPLVGAPLEVALVRRRDDALVSLYETGPVPDILVLDRPVSLRTLLDESAEELRREAGSRGGNAAGLVLERLADRAQTTPISRLGSRPPRPVERSGGALLEPPEDVPLTFGFRAQITPGRVAGSDSASRADVHALLFPGELWVWARGHRHLLARGPIMPAISRMVTAVQALIDAWETDRPANVRLVAGSFTIGVRLGDDVTLTLLRGAETVTLPALDVGQAALPILRLASDVIRAMVATDRQQARNLKVRSLREDVRGLRRRVRARQRDDGFVNTDADRLRADAGTSADSDEVPTPAIRREEPPLGKLRFAERWSAEMDGLDATSTFFCGDRLVVATPSRAVAVSRDDGDVLWVREGLGGRSYMAGQRLVRLSTEGQVELCDVSDGEAFATTRITPPSGMPPRALFLGGGPVPPSVILPDGPGRLVAVDLRNGTHRFGYAAKGSGPLRLKRAGRLVLTTAGDGTLDAIDAVSGEVVWRHAEGSRFCFAPTVVGDTVIAVSGDPVGRAGALIGLDLFSGERLFRVALPAPPTAAPTAFGRRATIGIGTKSQSSLACVDVGSGRLCWMISDPGVGTGGACLAVDDTLIVNTPAGRICGVDLEDGDVRWEQQLSDPVADDVPRRLEPVLRGGALFVPAASVHILRPTDGAALGTALPCPLVPDLVRVDERGWVYVAEESGHLGAYAPVPHLTLVR
jgi:outer membrane protein assembly factor BamB